MINESVSTYCNKPKHDIQRSIAAMQELLGRADYEVFGKAVEAVVSAYKKGNCRYIDGNGGSVADTQYLAAEFVSNSPAPATHYTRRRWRWTVRFKTQN